jgi:hypothetical protein
MTLPEKNPIIKRSPQMPIEKDPETLVLMSKLMERLAAIRCDCEHAVYGHLLRERIVSLIDVVGLLIESLMGNKPTILSAEELAAPALNASTARAPTVHVGPTEELASMFRQSFPKNPIGS